MKRVLHTTVMALLIVAMLFGAMVPAAFAAGDPASASIPVKITMNVEPAQGELPALDEVSLTVKALTAGAPAVTPESTMISCEGALGYGESSIVFGPADTLGIYEYGVTIGYSSLPDIVINDHEDYFVVVLYVLNNEDFTGYDLQTRIYKAELVDGEYKVIPENKPDGLYATKTYAAPRKVSVFKTWPDGGSCPVDVILYEVLGNKAVGNDTVIERVEVDRATLSADCDWQHTFEELDSRKEYEIEESGTHGFVAYISYDKEDALHWYVQIANYKKLLQTGQLNWPIPVLLCFGSVFMAAGLLLMRKKDEQANA